MAVEDAIIVHKNEVVFCDKSDKQYHRHYRLTPDNITKIVFDYAIYKRFFGLKKELEEKNAQIEELCSTVDSLTEANKMQSATNENDRMKAEYYDNLCSKAGKILVIASDTAENILNRANEEACKIVGEATTKKDLMLKTFSDSVEDAAEDINTYIRNAVNDCIEKINKSVNEIKDASGIQEAPHTTRFINGN